MLSLQLVIMWRAACVAEETVVIMCSVSIIKAGFEVTHNCVYAAITEANDAIRSRDLYRLLCQLWSNFK